MRILFIAAGPLKANASITRAICLASELRALGHVPVLLLLDSPDTRLHAIDKGVAAFTIWVRSRSPIDYLRACWAQPRPDMIHLVNANLVGLCVGSWWRWRGAVVLSDWDEWLSRVPAPFLLRLKRFVLEHLSYWLSDAFVFASRYLEVNVGDHVKPRPCLYLPYAFDHRAIAELDMQGPAVHLSATRRYVVYVGSLSASYRDDLGQLKLLARACGGQALSLLIIGDGSERNQLERDLSDILPQEDILFVGWLSIPSVDSLMLHQQIVAAFLPMGDTVQNRARCPNKLFHYIRAMKSVVTNRVGEVTNLISVHGFYYKYDDVGSLADSLRLAVSHSPNYPLEKFTWMGRAAKYSSFVSSAFAKKLFHSRDE